MNKPAERIEITEAAAEGLINDESLAAARALIGNKLRPEQYLRDASVDSITIFANGVGDLNPLFRDLEYARWTRFGGLVAHPRGGIRKERRKAHKRAVAPGAKRKERSGPL